MLHDLAHQPSTLYRVLQLLRHRPLIIIPLLTLTRDVDVNCSCLGCQDLQIGRFLRYIDSATVALVDLDRGCLAYDLQCERVTFDDVDRGHEVVNDDTRLYTLADRDSVDLAVDLDVGVFAAEDEDRLMDFHIIEDKLRFILIVLLQGGSVIITLTGELSRRPTIIHLFPSSSFFGGLFFVKCAGFVFDGGAGDFALRLPEDDGRAGTTDPARSFGFLCVISLLSTLRKLAVTSDPRLIAANTEPTGPPAGELAPSKGIGGGGGGGGGGGASCRVGGGEMTKGGAEQLKFNSASLASIPLIFQVRPVA